MAITTLFFSGCGDQGNSTTLPFDWASSGTQNQYGFNINVAPGFSGNAFQFIFNTSTSGGLALGAPNINVSASTPLAFGFRIFPQTNAPYVKQCIAALSGSGWTHNLEIYIEASANPPVTLGISSNGGSSFDGSATVTWNTWTYVEFYFSAGFTGANSNPFAIYINGSSVTTGTLANSSNFNSATTNAYLGAIGQTTVGGESVLFDDYYFAAGSSGLPLGPQIVQTTLPIAQGASSQWVPFGPSGIVIPNWQCVNANPPNGDAQYVYTATPSAIDAYVMAQPLVAPGSVTAVKSVANVYQTGSGVRTYAVGLSNGVTTSFGSTNTPNGTTAASYAMQSSTFITNPFTSSGWQPVDLLTTQFAHKCIA